MAARYVYHCSAMRKSVKWWLVMPGLALVFYLVIAWFGIEDRVVWGVYWLAVALVAWFGMKMLVPAVRGRGWGCVLNDEELRWYFPGAWFGEDVRVPVSAIRRVWGTKRGKPAPDWYMELKDETYFDIPTQCVGNIGKMAQALSEVNPEIVFETRGFRFWWFGCDHPFEYKNFVDG